MFIRRALLITGLGLVSSSACVAQALEVDVAAVKTLLSEWNAAHTPGKVETLSSLYSDKVNFYGKVLRREKCLSLKEAMVVKGDFNQTLKNELILSGYTSGVIRCDFVKTVSLNNKEEDYKAYLIVKQFGGRYLIVGESDLVTDRKIGNEPDLGERIIIKNVVGLLANAAINEGDESGQSSSYTFTVVVIVASFVVGIIGLLIAWSLWLKRIAPKRSDHVTKAVQKTVASIRQDIPLKDFPRPPASRPSEDVIPNFQVPIAPKRSGHVAKNVRTPDYFEEKGLPFEKFVVQQFGLNRGYFTLLEWRSDKFHRGIYPKSNRNPDLEYEYKYKDFVRKFSVECKYRQKAFNGSVKLMDESKYRIYESFSTNQMPVYIVLGLGGTPEYPAELYVIPFKEAKLEMLHQELSEYRSPGKFYYDRKIDRLI